MRDLVCTGGMCSSAGDAGGRRDAGESDAGESDAGETDAGSARDATIDASADGA
jgi:hypothetical protein